MDINTVARVASDLITQQGFLIMLGMWGVVVVVVVVVVF